MTGEKGRALGSIAKMTLEASYSYRKKASFSSENDSMQEKFEPRV